MGARRTPPRTARGTWSSRPARRPTLGSAYTSARLLTGGRFAQRYGRFEARIKLPRGQGLWPAFWMMGADVGTAGWPACGEIDVMECRGQDPSTVTGTIHGPGYAGSAALTASKTPPCSPLKVAAGAGLTTGP